MTISSTTTTPTTATTLMAEVTSGSGSNSQSTAISTTEIALFLDISSISGTFDITVKTYGDSAADARTVWRTTGIDSTTTVPAYYAITNLDNNLLIEVEYDNAVTYEVKYRTPLTDKPDITWVGNSHYNTKVSIEDPITSFGDLRVAEPRAIIQLDPAYGLRSPSHTTTSTNGTGSVNTQLTSSKGYEYVASTGTNATSYGIIESSRIITHAPGQGNLYRFTGRFSAPIADSSQRIGARDLGTEISFGYNGTDFGILYRTGGAREIQTLTLSAGASGNETATVTLSGANTNVAITSGTAQHNAAELAAASYTNWDAYQNDDTVIFVNRTLGNSTGSFTFSSPGTAAGIFAETQQGRDVTDTWINQSDWAIDQMDGTGVSRMLLDPTKGNIFQISQQYLGYGNITFAIENEFTGRFQPVHILRYANKNTSPSLTTPSLRLGMIAINSGNTSNISVYSASLAAFSEGIKKLPRNPLGTTNTKTSVTTTETNILSIRNRVVFNDRLNFLEILPRLLSVAVDGSKPVEIKAYLNTTLGGTPNWTYLDDTESAAEIDTTGTTITGGVEVFSATVSKEGSTSIDLHNFDLYLTSGDTLTIAAAATSSTTDVTASLTWQEG